MTIDFPAFLKRLAWLPVILAVNTFVFGEAMMSNVRILVLLSLSGLFVIGLASLQKSDGYTRDGWNYLSPSAGEWVGFFLCMGATCFFVYIYLFVGSDRPDADEQMFALMLLIIVSAGAAIATLLFSFVPLVRWNDECIQRRTVFLRYRTIRWEDLGELGEERRLGYLWLASTDGTRIRFSVYQNGAIALKLAVEEKVADDFFEAEPEFSP
jgi:hypothetical protein